MRVGMHRDVSGDVVENIRFRQVIQASRLADSNGGGELAIAQAIEKQECGHISGNRSGAKTGQWRQEAINVVQARDAILRQAQRLQSCLKAWIRVPLPAGTQPAIEVAPGFMVLG